VGRHHELVPPIRALTHGATRLPEMARSLGQSARIFEAEIHPGEPTPVLITTTGAPPGH
jgi:hypothetical protein